MHAHLRALGLKNRDDDVAVVAARIVNAAALSEMAPPALNLSDSRLRLTKIATAPHSAKQNK
jgi:hypothetical protein